MNLTRNWARDLHRLRKFYPGERPLEWTPFQFLSALAELGDQEFPVTYALVVNK